VFVVSRVKVESFSAHETASAAQTMQVHAAAGRLRPVCRRLLLEIKADGSMHGIVAYASAALTAGGSRLFDSDGHCLHNCNVQYSLLFGRRVPSSNLSRHVYTSSEWRHMPVPTHCVQVLAANPCHGIVSVGIIMQLMAEYSRLHAVQPNSSTVVGITAF
jgi:hypothetical protein